MPVIHWHTLLIWCCREQCEKKIWVDKKYRLRFSKSHIDNNGKFCYNHTVLGRMIVDREEDINGIH